MWAPITGPTSETKIGSRAEDLAAFARPGAGGLGIVDVLDDPGVAPVVLALPGELDQALEGAPPGAHALDRGDLLLERQDRLDLKRRAEPAPARRRSGRPCAGTRACRSRTTSAAPREPRSARVDRLAPASRRRATARGGDQSHQPMAAAGRAAVDDVDALAAVALVDQPLLAPGWADSQVPEIPAERWIETISRPASSSGLVDCDEVADRRLRGRRARPRWPRRRSKKSS